MCRGKLPAAGGGGFTSNVIDDLAYTYPANTNRLENITDNGVSGFVEQGFHTNGQSGVYAYDANGNLKADPYKELDITYNYLNLPEQVTSAGGSTLSWLYDANGMKLRKTTPGEDLHLSGTISSDTYEARRITSDGTVPTGNTVIFQAGNKVELLAGFETQLNSEFKAEVLPTNSIDHDYVGGIEYRDGLLEAIYHAAGRIYFGGGSPRYEYTLTDHLGNTRITFADLNSNGTIEVTTDPVTNELLQEHHYYPFGMQMEGDWKEHPGRQNPYQYNGKELNQDLGLNWLDYGARWYDPSIGRFSSTDRFAEKYSSMTPYQYGANNPIKYIDINGDSLRLNFVGGNKSESLIGLMGIISNALEGQFQGKLSNISYDAESGSYSGLLEIVSAKGGGNYGELSEQGKQAYDYLSSVTTGSKMTKMNVAYARSDVHTGHFDKATIDVADMLQFNRDKTELGGTQIGKLVHEIIEQSERQQVGYNTTWYDAHPTAVIAENKVNSSTRTDDSDLYGVQVYERGNQRVTNRIITKNPGTLKSWFFSTKRRIIKVEKN